MKIQPPFFYVTCRAIGAKSTLHDAEENEFALNHDLRLMSVYRLRTGVTIWVITEADRSATTFLLPDEY